MSSDDTASPDDGHAGLLASPGTGTRRWTSRRAEAAGTASLAARSDPRATTVTTANAPTPIRRARSWRRRRERSVRSLGYCPPACGAAPAGRPRRGSAEPPPGPGRRGG
jgi:hypothetical protein